MPVLMVFGEHDHIVPAAAMAAVEPLIQHGRTALIEQVAHVPFLSAPDTFIQAVYDFYRDYQLVGKNA
jgi:pimeloyl-[acyl-carrier protein] methyl ester esterase